MKEKIRRPLEIALNTVA